MWKVLKFVSEPTQLTKRVQQLNRAALLQIGLNFVAFMVASLVLNLVSPLAAETNLFIACLLGYTPEAYVMKKSDQSITIKSWMRWLGGALIYVVVLHALKTTFPASYWVEKAYSGFASLLSIIGEVGGAWLGVYALLIKNARNK